MLQEPAVHKKDQGGTEEQVIQEYGEQGNHTQFEKNWTEEEEQKLVRRWAELPFLSFIWNTSSISSTNYWDSVDMIVMPLLMLGYFAFQLDRGNM